MNLFELSAKVGLDTSAYESGVKSVLTVAKKVETQIAQLKAWENLEKESKEATKNIEQEVENLTKELKQEAVKQEEALKEPFEDVADVVEKEMEQAEQSVKTSLNSMQSESKKFSTSFGSSLKTGLTVGFNALKTGVTVAVGALATFGTGMVALAETTREYRADLATLDVAFRSVGNTVENGTALYQEFYGLLGETDQAVEAANQLATIAQSQEDVAKWTDIAAGIMSTFQDSMPLETLTESVAQTSELGKITGVLADAVNRAGMSEEEFNAQLAELTTQQERAAYITEFLNNNYAEAGDMYQELNKNVIDARKAQEDLNSIMADFGGIIEPLVTTGKTMLVEFLTPFTSVAQDAVNSLISGFESGGVSGLISAGSELLGDFLVGLIKEIPNVANVAIDIIVTLAQGLIDNAPEIALAAGQLLTSLAEGIFELLPMLAELAISLIVNFANYLAENADQLLNGAIIMIQTLGMLIIENLPLIINTAIQLILAIVNAFANNATLFADTAVQLMMALITGLWQAAPQILVAIAQLIAGLINMVFSFYGAWISAGVDLINSLWTGLKNIWPSVTSWFSSVLDNLRATLHNIGNNFVSIGTNIVNGIKNGIANAWNNLVSWFEGLFGDLIGIAERILGIASPSKVFKVIGGYTAEGFGLGFEDKFKNVSALIESSLDFSGAVKPITTDVTGGENGGGVSIVQNIYSQAKTAADLMQEAIYQQERAVLLGAT